MFYECIGPNQYLFTMKLFRDCNSTGAAFDDPATFGFFNSDGDLVGSTTAFVGDIQSINTDLDTPCLGFPPDICVEEGIYTFEVTLPNDSETFEVVYQRCCRNGTIQNLIDPGAQGLTIVATVPPASVAACNSSPSFDNFPPPVLCAGETLVFDHSATDADGDELVYSLCAPYIGATQAMPMPGIPSNPPYAEVSWGAGFSAVEPLNGNPGLAINSETGLLTGVPTQLGQFVVGVCVEEWRDGQLVSTNTRDFQFNVQFCDVSSEAIIAEPSDQDLCQGLTFTFQNLSNPANDYVWTFGDPTTEDDFSTAFNTMYTFPDTGLYTIMLISNPGFVCSDTAILNLPLYNGIEVDIDSWDFVCVNGQQVYSFNAGGTYDEDQTSLVWDFGPNATPATASGETVVGISFSETGEQPIQITATQNICTGVDNFFLNVSPAPVVSINPQTLFCNGFGYGFSQTSTNANTFLWDFGVSGTDDDQSNMQNPIFTYPSEGIYTVTLTASTQSNCPATVTEVFDIRPLLAPEIEPIPVYCYEGHSVDLFADGLYTPDADFQWEIAGAFPPTSSAENPEDLFFLEPGNYPAELTMSENGCSRSVTSIIRIHANPIAEFSANPVVGCTPLSVTFTNESFTQSSSVDYDWDFGDGTQSKSQTLSHTYTHPGIYTVSLFLENLNGCLDSDGITKTNLIEVLPTPQAGFKLDPIVLSVVDPTVEVIDASEGALTWTYHFDGQSFSVAEFSHTLENIEPQPIRQTVMNEHGCKDEAFGEIFISDHLIYVPTAFTPDGDGLNDIFKPVLTGVVNYEMHIMDRWGTKVYSEEDVQRGWDGGGTSKAYFAEAGVYQYIIRVTDFLGWNYDYTGTITLIR